jgi:hypothetical protein
MLINNVERHIGKLLNKSSLNPLQQFTIPTTQCKLMTCIDDLHWNFIQFNF